MFRADARPDAGNFQDGRLKWDILNLAAVHRTRLPTVVDLTDCSMLRPYSIACLAAVGARTDRQCQLILPKDPDCASHVNRMGLGRWFSGMPQNLQPREGNIVLEQLTDQPGNFATRAVEVLVQKEQLPANAGPAMANHLDELVYNALTHSDSPIGCITVGQSFWQTGRVELCVVDLGQTIRGHLVSNPEHADLRTDSEAIRKALEEGVTGTVGLNRWNQPNGGAGLFELSQYALGGRAELAILSGNTMLTVSGEGIRESPFQGGFWGTLVNVRFLIV